MIIGILLVALQIFNIFLLMASIVLYFMDCSSQSIAALMYMIVIYCLIYLLFSKYTKHYLKKEKDALLSFKIINCIKREKGIGVVEFRRRDNQWHCVRDENVRFQLQGYLFKKSFIIAMVIRAVRYPAVSKRLELLNLFIRKLENNKIDELIVRFVDNDVIKEYYVVKNYMSKNVLLSQEVTKSQYYDNFTYGRSYAYLFRKEKIDEKIYLDRY